MENKKSRKNRKHQDQDNTSTPQTESKVEETIQKYLNINPNNLSEDDLKKIENYYSDRIELSNKLLEEKNLEELFDLAETNLRKNSNLELEVFQVGNKSKL